LHKEAGNKRGVAYSLCRLGALATDRGDYPSGAALYGESVELYDEAGDTRGRCMALGWLGDLALRQGDVDKAAGIFEE
jgi:hypothetical protein